MTVRITCHVENFGSCESLGTALDYIPATQLLYLTRLH